MFVAKCAMEGKKISFGFSKIRAKPNQLAQQKKPRENEEKEYITSFDKNVRKTEDKNQSELVIPVKLNYSVEERIVSRKRKQEESMLQGNGNVGNETDHADGNMKRTSTVTFNEAVSIESLAIQELIDDSKKMTQKSDPTLSIPTRSDVNQEQEEPASNDVDYGSVPVSQFGYAMLRGMGWAPGKGVGKKNKVVEVVDFATRPRSLGLGAECMLDRKSNNKDKLPRE